jgi:hypothetical protein
VDFRLATDLLVVEKRDQDDDGDRNTEKPKQNSTAQMTLLRLALMLTADKQAVA